MKQKKCRFCGSFHEFKAGLCKSYGKLCKSCSGRIHFAVVCKKSKPSETRKKLKAIYKNDEETKETSSDVEEEKCFIRKIIDKSHQVGKVTVNLNLKFKNKWRNAQCELDTGSDVCLIGYDKPKEYCEDENIAIKRTSTILQNFGGSKIPVVGEVVLDCERKKIISLNKF